MSINSMFENGSVVAFQMADKSYLVALLTTTKNLFVPVVKMGKSMVANISTKYSFDEYTALENLIKNLKDAMPEAKGWKPFRDDGPAGLSLDIDKIVTVKGAKNPDGLRDILAKAGYTLPEAVATGCESKKPFRTPELYAHLMDDPTNKAIFETDKAKLEKAGATFEGLPEEIKTAFEGIVYNSQEKSMILLGPAGTGKSWAGTILAQKLGTVALKYQVTTGTREEDLTGKIIAKEGEGGWEYRMGPLLKAYVEGYPIVIDEINYANDGVMNLLNQFTEDESRVCIDDKVYFQHPGFFCILTMNPGYEFSQKLNQALKNRIVKVSVPKLSEKEFNTRMFTYSEGKISRRFFSKLQSLANFLEKEGKSSRWREDIVYSVRNAQMLVNRIALTPKTYEEFKTAFFTSYVNDLNCDNDNSEKLEAYKLSSDFDKQIRDLYELYDLRPEETVPVSKSLEELMGELEGMTPSRDGATPGEVLGDLDVESILEGAEFTVGTESESDGDEAIDQRIKENRRKKHEEN